MKIHRLLPSLSLVLALILAHQVPAFSQGCTPGTLGYSRSAIATRLLVSGNEAQRPASEIGAALNGAMGTWNSSPCQSSGISYPWFQSQASGAEARIRIYFNDGIFVGSGNGGPTSCGIFLNHTVPEIHIYTHADDGQGNIYSCDGVDLDVLIAHELGHYLGLNHTPFNSSCEDHLMYPILSGNESLQPIECQVADSNNQTSWEEGQVGCTESDWCDPDHCSPILIDFGGDLFQLSGAEEPVLFDIDGTGRQREIGWTRLGTDDGFLCRDLNGNGQIDSGVELFGTATRLANGDLAMNGYEAMAELDKASFGGNGDGLLNPQDAAYWSLCIWRDTNRNAVSEEGEVRPLAHSGVVALDLAYEESPRLDDHNNVLFYHSGGTVLRDGFEAYVRTVDVFFVSSTGRAAPEP